jgi:hypothetical protein
VRHIYVCGLLAGWLSIMAAAAQAGEYRPPRLPDGQIDLQGVWSHKNITPLERPAELKSFVISREEAAQLQARILAKTNDQSKPGEPAEYFWERGVEAIRGEYRSSIITDPADGKIPATDHFKALAKRTGAAVLTAFDGPEARPGSERCLAAISAAPPVTAVPAADLRQFVQTPQFIAIASEELHEARIVRMNARHGPAAVVSWLGDSIGWWDGETLVIETKYFSPTSAARGGPGSLFFVGPDTTVTERITRVSADELRYLFTVEDATYYTQPWKGETHFGRSSDQMLEYACHEGNYSLGNALMSARELENAAVAKE